MLLEAVLSAPKFFWLKHEFRVVVVESKFVAFSNTCREYFSVQFFYFGFVENLIFDLVLLLLTNLLVHFNN